MAATTKRSADSSSSDVSASTLPKKSCDRRYQTFHKEYTEEFFFNVFSFICDYKLSANCVPENYDVFLLFELLDPFCS